MSKEETSGAAASEGLNDRRTSQRFPLRLEVKYRLVGRGVVSNWALSESLNISSTGLLFKTHEAVLPGQAIEGFICWPICLDNRVPLKLAIKGPIVRKSGDQTAMRFEHHEFKTRSASEPAADTV